MRHANPPDTDAPVFVARPRMVADPPTSHHPATHTYAAMAFYTGGRAHIEQLGRWTLEPGDVFVVPAGQPHRMVEARRPEYWGLGFCVPCLAADDAAGPLLEPFERVRGGAPAVVRIPPQRHAFLESLLCELEAAAGRRGRPGEPYAVQRSLLTLVLNEVRRAAQWDEGRAPGAAGVIAANLAFIERHCLRPLTLKEVAAAVGRSPAHVTTALARATGRSAVEWIIAGRMAAARRFLLHSDDSVETVAARVGYADATHFIRLFQRAHGTTPSAWRKARAVSMQPAAARR
jgi:AraC family transcriptional activator of pobA